MFTFTTSDTYKVSHSKKGEKFIVDYKLLVRLYEPIIGSVAMSLYLTLESELSLNKYLKTNNQIARLHKLLQVEDKAFNEAVESLKKYDLLNYKANQKKANDYLFIVYKTKSAIDFFKSNKLNEALRVMVDDGYYKQVYDYFTSTIINEDEYVDIDDISISKSMTEEEFYEQFKEKYPVISGINTINDDAKKEISRLRKLFNLSFDEIELAILNSMSVNAVGEMTIDLEKLNEFIFSKFQTKDSKLSQMEKIALAFDNERSITYYQKMSGRNALLPAETSMINELLDRYKISEGILNVVINFYFKYGKRTINVPKNYFKKVIEEMLINNVKTTIDAMNYFKNRNKRFKEFKEKNNLKNSSIIVEESKNDIKEEIDPKTLAEFKDLMGG